MRDDSGPPLGALPESELDGDTEPVVFRDGETVRRCLNCGAEIGRDENALEAGRVEAYIQMYDYMVASGISPVTAARTLEAIRQCV